MNRTDRLLAIVIELQAHRRRRADDLAATFEVSKRTIYPDVLALCEAGVPVISTPGRGYSLDDGYFLPPLSFTADEAVLLLLGAVIAASVVLLVAAGAALVVLVVTARAVELGHADRFQSPPSLENIRHDMLHEWWPMEDAA